METINYLLGYENLKIYQDDEMFKFSLDSVLLAHFVSLSLKKCKILDIGTGNAIIPILLTTKTSNKIDAVEIQKDVYNLGKKSIEINKLENQISIYNKDIKDYASNLESDIYDTITCNPPFFKNMKENISEHKQIARHEKTLKLEEIFEIAKKLLKNNGNIAIVHRPERLIDIISSMKKNNIEPKKIQFIYPKSGSNSDLFLIESTKNGHSGVKILPGIVIHNNDDSYTDYVRDMFGL